MSLIVIQHPEAPTLAEALATLRATAPQRGIVHEIGITEPVDPLSWLSAQPAGERLYWADRSGERCAGWGFADTRTTLHGDLYGRYYGGMAFDPDAPRDPAWEPLGRQCFFLPRLLLRTTPEGTTLRLDRRDGGDLEGVTADHAAPIAPLRGAVTGHQPAFSDWCAGIQAATEAFAQGMMRKVVLARQSTITLGAPVDPFALLARLQQPGGFVFGFEVAAGHAFVGCSPERLFRREGRALSTEALAGTRRRGLTRRADGLLAAELLASSKERAEHHHVVEAIEADLAPLCTALSRAERPRIRRLSRVQHLHTPFSGTLAGAASDSDLLAAMHPTPAVCGRPTERARAFIRETEPFDRGWYAGPVGWVDYGAAEFAVAIRSALVVGDAIRFCTGAGIVEGSAAESEWAELDAKSSGIVGLLADEARIAVGS